MPEDTIGTLYDRLMNKGVGLVLETVEKLAAGDIKPIEQQHIDESTLKPAPKIFKEDCLVDWSKSGRRIVDFVRGLSPYPAAWSRLVRDGEELTVKIFRTSFQEAAHGEPIGTIRTDWREELEVACSDGWICIHELQVAGKRRMTTHDLLLGFRQIESYEFR